MTLMQALGVELSYLDVSLTVAGCRRSFVRHSTLAFEEVPCVCVNSKFVTR